ncbi:hypothetical protein CTI12_AA044130 [Artemisia annua]|uniref:Peptidase A1 domain-containing protein n=1 Tax=Artemisia annua TaxID=35608 RepID=A0A2U1PKZ0_ARTAN|nr:hypothetical protein CTI12_AA044130 [Artemisia annua]
MYIIPDSEIGFICRLYYAKVLLGSPPKEFLVQTDTGSNGLWNYYDESVSSTSYLISCSDKLCSRATTTCTSDRQAQCSYTLHQSSGTNASGYYISDVIHLNINGTSEAPHSVLFVCSTSVAQPHELDGVFGFGRQSFSVINQLDSLGVTPHVFSYCLDSVTGGDKLIVYDLERQRIGWVNYDCSPYINATTTAPSSGVTSEPEILLKLLALLLLASFSLGIM